MASTGALIVEDAPILIWKRTTRILWLTEDEIEVKCFFRERSERASKVGPDIFAAGVLLNVIKYISNIGM